MYISIGITTILIIKLKFFQRSFLNRYQCATNPFKLDRELTIQLGTIFARGERGVRYCWLMCPTSSHFWVTIVIL